MCVLFFFYLKIIFAKLHTYQYKRRFSPFVLLHVTAYSSNCRLCLVMHQLRAAIVQHRHAQMSMHCVTDVSHLHHMLESMHHSPATIQPPHVVRTLNQMTQATILISMSLSFYNSNDFISGFKRTAISRKYFMTVLYFSLFNFDFSFSGQFYEELMSMSMTAPPWLIISAR